MKSFVILCFGRSGSNLLMDLLNTKQSVCIGELYHKISQFLKLEVPGYLTMADRDADPLGYYHAVGKAIEERYPRKLTWGYKLFLHHSQEMLDFVCSSQDIPVVILRRENKLARYSSWQKAMMSGEFIKHSPSGAVQQDQRVEFCSKAFGKMLRYEHQAFEALYAKLDQNGKEYRSIEYCELGSPEVVDSLYSYLGIDGRLTQSVRYHKQGTGFDILDRFSNPDEVLEYVESHELTHWLSEQSPRVHSV